LFDYSTLKKYDPSGMHKIYDEWPEIAEKSYNSSLELVNFDAIDSIIFAGMGGSGSLGDVFSSILSKSKINVYVTKGYHLPKPVDSNTLVVATSISGNTVETMSLLDSAKNLPCKTIGFSSGGKMQEFCKKNKIEFREASLIHSPRSSFTSFLFSMLHVLNPILGINKNDVHESIDELKKLQNKISSSNLIEDNSALALAKWISQIPIIYYPCGFQSAALRFKNSLQENAKQHAMVEDVIEACHNGIVAWEKKSIVQPILVQGTDDYSKTKERWVILKEYLNENNIDYHEVFSVGGSILSKIIHLIYLFDYSTIYLATLSGIDPSPIKSIDFITKKLNL